MQTETESFLNTLTSDTAAETTTEDTPIVDESVDTPDDKPIDEPEAVSTPLAGKETSALLDSLTEGAAAKKPDAAPDSGKPTGDQPDAATPKTEEAPPADKTLDQQEAEALDGIKSERGRERIKAVFAERRELEAKATQLESDINEFREMVKSTGMKPDEFAQTLEFGRLVNSGNEADLRVALQMVDAQREVIAKRLGVEVPGVDPLADFPDLKADVDNMAVTRERALEVAKYRRQQQAQQKVQQVQQAQVQERQEWETKIANVTQTAESYFATREKEADYPAKMAQITAKFKDPAFMQEFVTTYQPEQWFGLMKMMYDSIVVPAAPRQQSNQQPIRSRPVISGAPAAKADAPIADRLMSHLDSMGL